MMIRSDFHMHTTFCDGQCTPEEMVLSAIEKGLATIGFSGHSYTPFDLEACMDPEGTAAYRTEVARLREKYKDQIDIYCGVEQDILAPLPELPYDYSIGSVHFVEYKGERIIVDFYPERIKAAIDGLFGGDVYLLCEEYYKMAAQVAEKTGCDIVGHFDLISKYNEGGVMFDSSHPRYVAAWQSAAEELLKKEVLFEINTGAISRRCRTFPYPSLDMMHYIADRGGKFILSSDAHHKDNIAFQFEKWKEFLSGEGIEITEFTPRAVNG